jgi:peptide deformylase
MPQPRSIMQSDNLLLRQVAQPIGDFRDRQVQSLIDDLLVTVKESNGVGIAAPQVGQSWQVMVVASRPNPRYPKAPEMIPLPMLNPQMVSHGTEIEYGWEGCLSVPGVRGWVPRYRTITVAFYDRDGQPHTRVLTDFVARIWQHEFDHFQGILFVDRVEQDTDLITEQDYQEKIVPAQLAGRDR